MTMPSIMLAIRDLTKHFPAFSLDKVTLEITRGEYFVLLGPTGAGKTVLVELLCGLRFPDAGTIALDGVEITNCDPAARRIGYVPQDYALLPFMTVAENIGFGLQAHHLPAREIEREVAEMMRLLGIAHLAKRVPTQLSGGERQRVALGRALVIRPAILLLDEPFSAIDEGLRDSLGEELLRIHTQLQTTTIHICHNLEEAVMLGDRLGILENGRLIQTGSPREVLTRPANAFVTRFLRLPNVAQGLVRQTTVGSTFFIGEQAVCDSTLSAGPALALFPTSALQVSRSAEPHHADYLSLPVTVSLNPRHAYRHELLLTGTVDFRIPGLFPPEEWPNGSPAYVRIPRAAIHLMTLEKVIAE